MSSSSKAPSNNSSGYVEQCGSTNIANRCSRSEVSETPFWLSDKKEQAKGASSTLSEKNLVALAIETESSMQASVIDKGADAASDKTLSPKVSSYQLGGSYVISRSIGDQLLTTRDTSTFRLEPRHRVNRPDRAHPRY